MIKNWRNTGLAVAANMRRACAPNPSLFKLAPILPRNYSLRGATPSRWRLIVGCLLPLQVSIHAASPAFSYTDNLDSYLASKFVQPIQLTFENIPPSAGQYGIESHPDPDGAAHMYDRWCCSLRDCRPLKPGSVKITNEGYLVPLPDGRTELVKFNSNRIKQPPLKAVGTEFAQTDHGCYHKIAGIWRVRCFYPRPGAM